MSQQQCFIDSSVLIAIIDSNDVHHTRACSVLETIIQQQHEVFLSDVVLNEVLSALSRRCSEKKRSHAFSDLVSRLAMWLENRPVLCLYQLMPHYYPEVVQLMKQTEGRLSFHDCLIVLFLKEVPEVTLVTFDSGFKSTPVKFWENHQPTK